MKTFRLFFFLFIGITLGACQSPSEKEVISQLNGYWKVTQVKDTEGQLREYSLSTNIDYIEIDSNHEGFRLKVQPQPDSTFLTTSKAEHFTIKQEEDSLRFYYETTMDNWKETLVSSKKDQFTVKNEQGITYTYERFKSIQDELESH